MIRKNKCELLSTIRRVGSKPINSETAGFLAICWAAYRALCLAEESEGMEEVEESNTHFDLQMAKKWVNGMVNSDGSHGPHWSMEKTREIQEKFDINCDETKFWVVINSLYSDYREALVRNNASNLETYACLAKAWLNDPDAVPNKLEAYFTYIVKH